jgi:tetratricopeptide (TPR) repeat protein
MMRAVAVATAPCSNVSLMALSRELAALRPKLPSSALLAAALAFLLAAPAVAGEDTRSREARMACLSGDYARGVTILSELFVSTRIPTYIYNQGRCFEQNARYREAISRFQEYLRVAKDAPADARADAEKHIADCRNLLAQDSPSPSSAGAPPAPRERVVAPPAPPPPPPASAPAATVAATSDSKSAQAAAEQKPGAGLRTAGVVVAVVGGAAVVAGVALNLKVNSMASDYETYNGYTKQKESQRKNYETWGWVSYGAGAACLATGALLYYLGLRPSADGAPSVAALPTGDGATLVVRGAL